MEPINGQLTLLGLEREPIQEREQLCECHRFYIKANGYYTKYFLSSKNKAILVNKHIIQVAIMILF